MMIDNGYVALLQHDVLKMRHPNISNKIVTLYKIIAMKTFSLTIDNGKEVITKIIEKYSIGGYVESIQNLDTENPVWIDNSARVFDNAYVSNGSLVQDTALVYDDSIVNNSFIGNHARIHGNSKVTNTSVLGFGEIKDNVIVSDSYIKRSAKIYENATIVNSNFSNGSSAHGNCNITDSTITDISEIRGNAVIINCKYSGRVIREDGTYTNETVDNDMNLLIHEEIDESTHTEYNI